MFQLNSIADRDQYYKLGVYCLTAFSLSAGLSIALSKIFLGLLLLIWLIRKFLTKGSKVHLFEAPLLSSQIYLITPMVLWLTVALVATCTGIDFSNSIEEFIKSSLHFLFPLLILSVLNSAKNDTQAIELVISLIKCLALSMGLAAIHSFVNSSLGYSIQPKIPGPVTESGQLTMVIPLALGLCLAGSFRIKLKEKFFYGASLLLIALGSWPASLGLSPHLGLIVISAGLALMVVPTILDKYGSERWPAILLVILLGSLIVNLKRGPWLGVFSAIFVYGLLSSKKLALSAVVVAAAIFVTFEPVRERAFDMVDHFNIGGGRGEIWTLGMELVQRYPLGVGPDNASVIRKMDSQLPELHRHMHNNLLNITVETGWLGLTIFCLWIFRLIYSCLSRRKAASDTNPVNILLLSTGCAVVAWQVAGLVEYNFGDGEVRLIAFCLTGFIIALVGIADRQQDRLQEI